MRVKMLLMVSLIGSSIIVGSGCAKKELVKKEEPVPAPAPVAQPTPPVQQPETIQPVKQEPMQSQPVPVETEKPKVVEQKPEVKVELADIYFAFDSYTLDTVARDTLFKASEILKQNSGTKIRIEGNCDERGSDEYNLALGEKRARAALQYLVTLGVPEQNLSFISYGEEKPAYPGHDESAWIRNRNDHFVVVAP